ncbi:MAG: DUF3237 family protein [Clostridia bacterium]|nr:DUF3237 family protein [Clostridia bacterium]
MNGKPILDIKIEFNGPAPRVKGDSGEVLMIPFTGRAEGEIFTGIVEPCGVDTQVVDAAGLRHMSARYMLTGTDAAGMPCRIYVENEGWFEGGVPMPFRTTPAFVTDSPMLAARLCGGRIVGEGSEAADGLHIRFYEADGQG